MALLQPKRSRISGTCLLCICLWWIRSDAVTINIVSLFSHAMMIVWHTVLLVHSLTYERPHERIFFVDIREWVRSRVKCDNYDSYVLGIMQTSLAAAKRQTFQTEYYNKFRCFSSFWKVWFRYFSSIILLLYIIHYSSFDNFSSHHRANIIVEDIYVYICWNFSGVMCGFVLIVGSLYYSIPCCSKSS